MRSRSNPESASQAVKRRRRERAGLRRRQRFLADALHQLRNAVTTLMTQAALLGRSGDQAHVAELASAMEDRLRQLGRFLHQLDQIERPRRQSRLDSRFDAAGLARSVVAEWAAVSRARGVDLGWVGHESAVFPVRGAAFEWREALTNVVDNAIRHTAPGCRVDVSVSLRGDYCAVCVADQGTGLSTRGRQLAFARGVRNQHTSSGGGLGLDIALRVAHANGGSMRFEDGLEGLGGHPGLAVVLLLPSSVSSETSDGDGAIFERKTKDFLF